MHFKEISWIIIKNNQRNIDIYYIEYVLSSLEYRQ